MKKDAQFGITTNTVSEGSNAVITTKISITSAEILALNSTPIQLLPASGSGKVYQILDVMGRLNYLTASYATNTNLRVLYIGVGLTLFTCPSLIAGSALRIQQFNRTASVGSTTQILGNTAVYLDVQTGNPTSGSGSLDIYISYKVIDV